MCPCQLMHYACMLEALDVKEKQWKRHFYYVILPLEASSTTNS